MAGPREGVHLMKHTLLLLTLLTTPANAFDGKVYETQYGGPPMWDRGPNPEYRRERPTFRPRPYGPQMEPCIYRGDCRGPGYRLPPYHYPPRYDLYGDD